MSKRPQPEAFPFRDPAEHDPRLLGLLDEIEQEETPERLLKLAIELQQQLLLRKQRQNPN